MRGLSVHRGKSRRPQKRRLCATPRSTVGGFSNRLRFKPTRSFTVKVVTAMLRRWMPLISVLGLTIAAKPATVSGQSMRLIASFSPTAGGSQGKAVSILSNPTSRNLSMALSATGLQGQLGPGLYFGSVRVGTTVTQTMALPNTGPGAVTISAVTSSDPHFVVSGLAVPMTVPAGGMAAVTVAFSPTSSVPYTASMSVTSNAVAGSQVFLVSGRGVSHSVSLHWRASTSLVAGYNIYRSTVPGGPYTKQTPSLVPGTAWRDTSVVAGQQYYYVVTAIDSTGQESGYSYQASALVPSP